MKKMTLVPKEDLTISGQRVIEDDEANVVALIGDDQDAEYIIKAVTSHKTLVDALQEIALMDDSSGYAAMRALKEVGLW